MTKAFPFDDKNKRWRRFGNDIPDNTGLYAIFIEDYKKLPDKWVELLWPDEPSEDRQLLYIGSAKSLKRKLETRIKEHFDNNDSGTSTFRRSIGAILDSKQVALKCLPARNEKSDNQEDKYKFDNESGLSNWIQENCSFTAIESTKLKKGENERYYIKKCKPSLNIRPNSGHNPNAIIELEKLRGRCAAVALNIKMSQRRN